MRATAYLALVALVLLAAWPASAARTDALASAEHAIARGRYGAALAALEPLAKALHPRALALVGRIHTLRGEREAAARAFRKVIDLYRGDDIDDRAGLALWAVAEASAQLGDYRDANSIFARAVAARPQALAIELAWAELFMQKHALNRAERSVDSVLTRAPWHARALALKARIALERGADFAAVEQLLTRALERDATLVIAHVTRAGIALRDEDLAAADRHLDQALAINPRELEALSVRAAVRFVADDAAGFARAVHDVLAENPRFSRLYSVVATYAEWQHRYPELVTLSEAALRIDPDDAAAHATRGINLLRTGREQEGLAALVKASALDGHDEQVRNLLELYARVIEPEYESFDVPPFRVRMAKSERALLAPYALPLLLRTHAELAQRYDFEPSSPIHVELYSSPEHFSIRATGLPRLGVQGICFGSVLIALSPRAGDFNWGQILAHELSHVFHVQRSKGRVPRWFTEGLAEYETALSRPEWAREDDRALYDALLRKKLPPLAQMNRAFTHARSPEQMTVAYSASALAARYLAERFGFSAIVEMLTAWGEGLSTEQVFARVLGSELAEVDRAFRATLEQRLRARYVGDLRVDLADYEDLARARERSRAATAGPDEHAALALSLALHGESRAAVARARALLVDVPAQAVARFTLLHVALERGDLATARGELETLLEHGHDGYQLRMLGARIALALAEPARAAPELAQAMRIDPNRPEAYVLAVQVADLLGDRALLERALTRQVELDQHARAPLARLLPLLAKRGAHAELVARAEAGLYRDVHDFGTHLALGEGLLALGRHHEARVEASRARTLARGEERERASRLAKAVEQSLRTERTSRRTTPASERTKAAALR